MTPEDVGDQADAVFANSITDLERIPCAKRYVLCGSHGGRYPAEYAKYVGVIGIVFNNAGVGRDGAGIAGLSLLDCAGMPAAAVSNWEARVGDARSMIHATATHVNDSAAMLGCRPGQTAADIIGRFRGTRIECDDISSAATAPKDGRYLARQVGETRVWLLDSAAGVTQSDRGSVVITGSHGGLVGGNESRALKAPALAAVFNDAGGGPDEAGWSRLAALDSRGIVAATVDADTARIGDAHSSYADGIISHINVSASRLGVRVRMTTLEFVDRVLASKGE